MFFKKKPPVVDYTLASKIASNIEGMLTTAAWEDPDEQLKKFILLVSKQGYVSLIIPRTLADLDGHAYVVPLSEIASVNKMNSFIVSTIRPGPFVNPFVSLIADEVVGFIKAKYN